jgi:Fe2+ or Zn2+ uptake regulation protein
MRDTKQRDALRSVLEASNRPLSIKELYQKTQKRFASSNPGKSDMSLATIYRNLTPMLKEGSVRSVSGIGMPPCYCRQGLHLPEILYQADGSLFVEAPKGFVGGVSITIITGDIG